MDIHKVENIGHQFQGPELIEQQRIEHHQQHQAAQNIIGTNLLTKFHEDRQINVASRMLTRKNAPLAGSHVFKPTGIIFELVQDIIGMNLLTKFHEGWKINVASRVLTRFYYSHLKKNAPPLGSHVFRANITNLLTKFHEDWTINVASREKCPAPGGHVLKATKTIFELIQDIIGTNLLTKFHDNRKINVTSRVLTRKNAPPPWWPCFSTIQRHVFQPSSIILGHVQDIIGINLLTEFHEDPTINVASRVKNAPPLGSHVFQAKVTIFKLIQDIIGTNLLTKFHEDRKINVASRVLTRKNAPPPGSHVFQSIGIIFKLF
ncbi:hypothetical protein DPMN_074172 [Dreissena polymorpha]|uniref:Uncharacterized protein n=1 Tax=Dreissena polymorpha TaxID=45954 RepID=A0A9D3YEG8_DREPO|nr:hypothetical protein DPMN_074172 [Dreissena polymorpha]